MKKIIVLVGENGSGKDSVCQYIKEKYSSVLFFRFSDPLSDVLRIFFNEIKREDQQWLGTALRERYGENILGEAIKKKIEGVEDGLIVLNGCRKMQEYEMVKEMGGKAVYITADPEIRWKRLGLRTEKKDDAVSFEKFLELEKAQTEITIPEIGAKADFKIINNGTKEDLHSDLEKILSGLI